MFIYDRKSNKKISLERKLIYILIITIIILLTILLIEINTNQNKYNEEMYAKVYDKYVVEPTDLSCTSQKTNNKKKLQ